MVFETVGGDNMDKTKYDPADTDCVISAANFLETSEFNIFRNAFNAWYGSDASEKQLEQVFIQYLQENRVPFWVRNYARDAVPAEMAESGSTADDSRVANNLLYFASIIAEYVLLACYLLVR